MSFTRAIVQNDSALPQEQRSGGGWCMNTGKPVRVTTDADHTIPYANISGGALYYSALSAGRAATTPTAADILAANPEMDIGDSFNCLISIEDAFALTWAAGTGVTLAGRSTTPASSSTQVIITKLTATTVEWFVM